MAFKDKNKINCIKFPRHYQKCSTVVFKMHCIDLVRSVTGRCSLVQTEPPGHALNRRFDPLNEIGMCVYNSRNEINKTGGLFHVSNCTFCIYKVGVNCHIVNFVFHTHKIYNLQYNNWIWLIIEKNQFYWQISYTCMST